MKKIMMMAAAVMISLAANAQTSPEAKAIKKLKTYAEVEAALKAAEASMSPEDQAFCYNKLAEIANKECDAAETDYVNAQIKKDEAAMAELSNKKVVAAYNAITNAKKAFALSPKAVKIGGQLQSLRGALVNGGLDAFNSKNYSLAQNYFGAYVDAKSDPLFAKVDFSKETGFGQIAYYAGLASYFNKDYKAASSYADVSLANPDTTVVNDALTLKVGILEEFAKSAQLDTATYISEVKKLFTNYADNDAIFSKLYTLYEESGNKAGAAEVLSNRLSANPTDAMANALKGQSAQNDGKYEDAIEAYGKVLAVKPDFLAAKLNLGVCYLTRAANVIDANTDARGFVKADKKDGIMADLNQAKKVLEECKAEDPDRLQANWSYPLERVNYILENIK